MSKQEILDSLPRDWKYTENNGFVHIRDANGNVRMKIDPPDKVTKYDHVHLFDESGNPIDVNLNVVDRKSPDVLRLKTRRSMLRGQRKGRGRRYRHRHQERGYKDTFCR